MHSLRHCARAVHRLERKLRRGDCTDSEMRECQRQQWAFARSLLQRPLTSSFRTTRLTRFAWAPDAYPNIGPRGDIVNRTPTKR